MSTCTLTEKVTTFVRDAAGEHAFQSQDECDLRDAAARADAHIAELERALDALYYALYNILMSAGDGGSRSAFRAVDLIPRQYMTAAAMACSGAAPLIKTDGC